MSATSAAPRRFRTLVADPPWSYKRVELWGRPNVADHYATLTLNEIKGFEVGGRHVGDLAYDDKAHLWLWTTHSHLRDAFDVVGAWGFTYKAALTWCKPQYGVGRYFRNNTEFLLFAARGNLNTKTTDQPTWFVADRRRHSEKPEESYALIERNSEPPYLELFARKRREGWSAFGDEVESDVALRRRANG